MPCRTPSPAYLGQVGIDQIYDAAVETQTHFNIEIMVGDTLINEEVRTE